MGEMVALALPPLDTVLTDSTFCTISRTGGGLWRAVFEIADGAPDADGGHTLVETLHLESVTTSQQRSLVARLLAAGWHLWSRGDVRGSAIHVNPRYWGPRLVEGP